MASMATVQTERQREGAAWHRRVDGLHVMKVKGSFYEMGRQHGAMLKDAIPHGPLPYYRTYLERMIGKTAIAAVSPLVWQALHQLVGRRVAKGLPPFALEAIRGLADGSEMPLGHVMAGCTMSDALVWVTGRYLRLLGVDPAVRHRLELGLGCTSAIAWDNATSDGKLLHARNFDYHGVESWPNTAAVVFHEPEQGQRYVAVTAAGIIMGGVTAMNEAGLSMTVHQHMFTDKAKLGGTPIGVVGDIVMREATNLDQAQAILEAHRPIGCWTYLVTDAHRREVLCYEENPFRQVAIRTGPDDKTFAYTNIYLDSELGATEADYYGSFWRHNRSRFRRAGELLKAGFGQLDPAAMAGILGDVGDSSCRIHQSIAMLMTVGSVVFRPEDGVLWVATGQAPTSHNRFVPFDLGREDVAPEHGELAGCPPDDENAVEAFEHYRRAYLAYFDASDLALGRSHVDRARLLQPRQPVYHAIAGLLALIDGEPGAGFDALSTALELGHPDPERLAGFHLWRARSLDLLGRRDEALKDYRATLGHNADPPVRRAARRGLRRPFRARQTRHVTVDFVFGDVSAP